MYVISKDQIKRIYKNICSNKKKPARGAVSIIQMCPESGCTFSTDINIHTLYILFEKLYLEGLNGRPMHPSSLYIFYTLTNINLNNMLCSVNTCILFVFKGVW